MDLTGTVTMEREAAVAMLAAYEGLRAPTPEDEAVRAGARALVAGKTLLDARVALAAGGQHPNGTPRLALARASWRWCHLRQYGANVTYMPAWSPAWNAATIEVPRLFPGTDPRIWRGGSLRTMVPPIPPGHRPARSRLKDYWIMWEVEQWEVAPPPPGDPALLRPITGWLCSVEHTWDLTDLERVVLAAQRRDE